MEIDLKNQLTIVVNSCDAYEDLWVPFFTLLKKYWKPLDVHILLNTETREFSFEGLDIQCVHSPKEYPYGKRMLNALSFVKTKYVLPLLDDFFLRSPVNISQIKQIIQWMEEDSNIVYFNCDCNQTYADWEVDKYPGYRRQPPANDYIMSMQAAIWRTKCYIRYWRPNVTPWEWELQCNLLSLRHPEHKFYCVNDLKYSFIDYGFNFHGMGVYRGKWVAEDVVPLFKKENITVDFSKRGFFDPNEKPKNTLGTGKYEGIYRQLARCLGRQHMIYYWMFEKYSAVRRRLKCPVEREDYYDYIQLRAQKRFLRSQSRK